MALFVLSNAPSADCLKRESTFLFSNSVSVSRLDAHVQASRQSLGAGGMRMSRTKESKDKYVATIKENLENAQAVFTFDHGGMKHRDLEKLRATLAGSKFMVAKNTLIKTAVNGSKWELLAPQMENERALIFAYDEDVGGAIKLYKAFNKETGRPKDEFRVLGGVFEGKALTADDITVVENLPTRQQLMERLGKALNTPTTKLARALKSIPTKLAIAVKEVSEGKGEKFNLEG